MFVVKQAAYRPPGLRGKPYTYKLVSFRLVHTHSSNFSMTQPHLLCLLHNSAILCVSSRLQHEEEPAQGAGATGGPEKLSKAAQKNRRKKENKQRAKEEVRMIYVESCSW